MATEDLTWALSSPERAYLYALDVINSRFAPGEYLIAGDPHYAFFYARDVIGGRFSLGEAVIAQDPRWAYCYARDVIQARWAEGEAAIIQEPWWAFYYARFLESQWFVNEFGYVGAPAVIETTVAQSPLYAYLYATEVIRARWPQGEPAIARGPYAYWYAREIIKHRWPAAEPTIVCSDKAVDYLHYFQKEFTKAEEIVWLLKQ